MSSVRDLKVIRFASAAHWALGIGARTGVDAGGVSPVRPLAPTMRTIDSPHGAHAPAYGPDGTLYWCRTDGALAWLTPDAATPCSMHTPGIAASPRLVVGRSWLWTFARDNAVLARFDTLTLRQDDAALPSAPAGIMDIAGDGRDGLWVLYGMDTAAQQLWHVSAAGEVDGRWPAPVAARSLARLGKHLVLLATDGEALLFADSSDPARSIRTIRLDAETPDCKGDHLDSDGRSNLFLSAQGMPAVLWLDAFGGLIQRVEAAAQAPIGGVAARGGDVWLAGPAGLTEYAAASLDSGKAAEGQYLSPKLYSPNTGDLRGWLRAELSAVLPRGSTISVRVMSTADDARARKADEIAANPDLSPAARQQDIEQLFEQDKRALYRFTADHAATATEPQRFSLPLFDHEGCWLWLSICFGAAPDGELPRLRELQVLYPNVSLMQYLPAIFHGDQGGVLRRMVGVLETTTQGLDRTISALAGKLTPATAPSPWLDYMARWIGIPWHDALPERTRRRLLANAEQLLAQRGTRAGLQLLLMLVARRATIRIVDHNADLGMLILGGHGRAGSAMPALLGGLPRDTVALSRRALLGQARLNHPNTAPDSTARFLDLVRIDISADAATRSALAGLLPDLIDATIPAGMRPVIRWRPAPRAARRTGIVLDDPSVRQLGHDSRLGMTILAPTGHGRLADAGASTDISLD